MLRVLVAMNPTPEAARLLNWAYKWAETAKDQVRITVIHVVPIRVMGQMGVEDAMAGRDLEAAQAYLTEVTRNAPVPIEVMVESGDPGPVICEAAKGYDLIVIGKHERGISDFLLGSTSTYVVRNAPCPVALVG
ncbi:MAG TPA: universal stress protein [Oscillatoriaceae cyanobacterium]